MCSAVGTATTRQISLLACYGDHLPKGAAVKRDVCANDKLLLRKNGEPLSKSLFDPVFQKEVNGLEKEIAWLLDNDEAVIWWHRIAVHQDWYLQGWQRGRVYPDFVACLRCADGTSRTVVLETKGHHLKGNEDTLYKTKLFQVLTEHSNTNLSPGELELGLDETRIHFEVILEDSWRDALAAIIGGTRCSAGASARV